jgi:hypothetical protein
MKARGKREAKRSAFAPGEIVVVVAVVLIFVFLEKRI